MHRFLVSFRKLVTDDRGHDYRALQEQVVVCTCSELAAAVAAKALFCETAGIVHWRQRADSCEVVELAEEAA